MTRLKSPLYVSLYMLAVLIAVMFILPLPASALDIASLKTERHVLVPGTNASFAPAPGLVLASEFSGFESKNRGIEVIVAFLDGHIRGIEEGFTEASFTSLGMNLMAKGTFTIDSRHAVLYKVLHDDGNMRWGKWVMLAENGPGTLVVNAVFVSGDTNAAVELEQMLKGVYMETFAAAAVPAMPEEAGPVEPSREEAAQSDEIAPEVVPGDDGSDTVSPATSLPANNADDDPDGFDRREALSILAREAPSSPDVTPHEERAQPAEPDDGEPEIRGAARIITEDGVIYAGDSSAAEETGLEDTAGDMASAEE